MFLFGLILGIIGLLLIEAVFPTQTTTVLSWIALRERQIIAEIKTHISKLKPKNT
jgi:hypothetical protein